LSRAARSLFVFGAYLECLAAFLILAPNVLLSLFGLAATHEVWIRCLGVVVMNIGIYYLIAARQDLAPIIVASVPVRLSLSVLFAIFVVFGHADPALFLFGAADAVGAAWTFLALRHDAAVGRGSR
jgi:hypothetical protein